MNNEKKIDNNRIAFLDVSKAFGIYLVILGHLVISNWKTFRFIFAFHMPLFFVVSGFIWNQRNKLPTIKLFMKKNIKHYLVPYLVALFLSIIQCILLPISDCNLKRLISSETIVDLYEGHFRFSYFGASWFLICMFWAQIFFYILLYIKKYNKFYFYLGWLFVLVFAVFSPDAFTFIPLFKRLPLKIDSAFMATLFIGIGYCISCIFKKFNLQNHNKSRLLLGFFFFVLGAFIVYFVSCKSNTYVNLCDAIYARPERYIIGSVFGSMMIIGLSCILEKIGILQYIGKNTLYILLSHTIVYNIIISLVNRLWKLDLVPSKMKFDLICIIISAITLIICLGISKIFEVIINLIKKDLEYVRR